MASPISRDSVERLYRLTPLQTGMLYHELRAGGPSPYHRQMCFDIEGDVDPAACESAWNGLLARHPLLRSVFDWERTAQPLQIVLKRQRVVFESRNADTEAAGRWREEDLRRGFDLAADPLMRVALFRLGPSRYRMIWSHPHILLDGWSGAVLMEEFGALYAAAKAGTEPSLPPAPDPDLFMAEAAARDDTEGLSHWRELLAGYEGIATLPRRPRSAQPPEMKKQRLAIDSAGSDALRALARRHGITLAVLLQAMWGLILGRWTGRRDVVFGIVTSGRGLGTPEIDRLVGMFINTLPVRVCWDPAESIGVLLDRLRRQSEASSACDHVALAAIQAASAVPDGLLDHLLVLENYPAGGGSAASVGWRVTGVEAEERSNYDFGLIVEDGETIEIALQFDAARIAPSAIERVASHWRVLAAALADRPEAPLGTIDPMGESEVEALEALCRGPRVPRDPTATLASLWHAQVDRSPEARAIVDGEVELSYAALDSAAEGVAARLRSCGAGRGEVVGLLCRRGARPIVALLGILKAGAAYLPLSPDLPDPRLAAMIEDSGCRRVLADDSGARRLEALAPGIALAIDGPPEARRAASPAAPDDDAYLLYTSGSTGAPKGVAVRHRGFCNMILAQIDGFGIRPDDAVVQFASCAFDASLSEIFMALLAGARLVVPSEAEIRDGAALLALFRTAGVTVATLPPSYLRALDGAPLDPLRVLITAGEPADPDDLRRLARRLTAFNAYGPTEASVCASWHRIEAGADYPEGIPIGRAIANMTMSVRDGEGRPMPVGAKGEIWLSGCGLARGYAGSPELNSERFPLVAGERCYRTGDVGVLRSDGEILYSGRLDFQVKLNGHRVELGEIEARLRGLPGIAQAAAVVAESPRRLLAFVVPRGPVDCGALRARLEALLPAWMIPAEIVPLPALPTTLAGKVDRRSLAASATAPIVDGGPMSPAEALVAEAFAAVLGGTGYGPDSRFSACGGDSLRAIRLLGRLRRGGSTVTLEAMLRADSVAAIARSGSRASAPTPEPQPGPVPLTPVQHWYFEADPNGSGLLAHQMLLRLPGTGEGAAKAAAALWERHDALRLRFARDVGGWTAEVRPRDAPFVSRSCELRGRDDPWGALAADAAAHLPGTAASGEPLFRATHYRSAEGDHLLLAAHHLVVDALSWRILIEDVAALLGADAPPMTSSYGQWAAALSAEESLLESERERPYWEAVAAARAAPARPAPLHTYDRTNLVEIDLGPVAPSLSERAVLAGLLARLGAALAARDGCAAERVTLSSHGRQPLAGDGLDVSRTVGWFTAEYPFVLDCGAAADAIEAALAEVPSGGVGWSVLRHLSGAPVRTAEPDIAVNFIGDIGLDAAPSLAMSERVPPVVVRGLRRTRAIEIEAARTGGRLIASIRYPRDAYPGAAVDALANLLARGPLRHHADDPVSLQRQGTAS